jgi:membrane associated rhomboid family serine protease
MARTLGPQLAAVVLTLAAPAVSTLGALTTGLNGIFRPRSGRPPGYGVTVGATVAVTRLAAALAALIARRDALVAIPVSPGMWLITGLAVVIAGIQLGHTGLAHGRVILVAASIIGTAAGMLFAPHYGRLQRTRQAMTMRQPGQAARNSRRRQQRAHGNTRPR